MGLDSVVPWAAERVVLRVGELAADWVDQLAAYSAVCSVALSEQELVDVWAVAWVVEKVVPLVAVLVAAWVVVWVVAWVAESVVVREPLLAGKKADRRAEPMVRSRAAVRAARTAVRSESSKAVRTDNATVDWRAACSVSQLAVVSVVVRAGKWAV